MSVPEPALPAPRVETAPFVFRPRTGLAACILWAVLGVVWLGLAARSSWSDCVVQAPFVAFISVAVYAVCARPLVRVGDRDVLLRNVVRDVIIPYSAIAAIDTQYTLTVTTTGGARHQAWAAPAGGRLGAARVTEEERKSLSWSGPVADIPASAGLRSDAGAAAVAIRRRLDDVRAVQSTAAPAVHGATAQVSWATGILIALLITGLAATVAVLLSA